MSNRAYPRAERVRAAIKQVLAAELERLKDPGLGLVTVTDVKVSPDIRQATAYYTVYGDEPVRAATRDALERARGHLRTVVAKQVRLRFAPTLEFVEDHLPEQASRLEQLIADLRRDDEEPST